MRTHLLCACMFERWLEIVRALRVRNCDNFYVTLETVVLLFLNSEFEQKIIEKILSGGSLGSYVDEGRSKMREIVWIAGHIEHRYSERKLQSEARLRSTPVWGSLLNLSTLIVCEWTSVCTKVTRSGMILYSRLCFGEVHDFTKSLKLHNLMHGRTLIFWPQIRREHSLNLSILLSEGKETNKDSLSNGEWRGKSAMSNRFVYGAYRNVTEGWYSGWVKRF